MKSIISKTKAVAVLTAILFLTTILPASAQTNGPGNALSLNGTTNYLSVPAGVWFNGNFTIEAQ